MATPNYSPKPFTNKMDVMLRKILPFVMRQEAAKPFLRPVDFIAYRLPDYPKVIKSSIDLCTIKERLIMRYYASFSMCLKDLNLMFENCYIYNLPDEPIILMALTLKQYLTVRMKVMPNKEFNISKKPKRKIVPLNNVKRFKEKVSNPLYIIDKNSFNLIKLDGEILPPDCTMSETELEKCRSLINELMSSKYRAINYLFLKSIDNDVVGLTDYSQLVKYPIDLSKIKTYLEDGFYESKGAFINDMYLMFNNCIGYNGFDSEIGIKCRRFQEDFENLYFSIFKEICKKSIDDEVYYFVMKIKRRHKEIENAIRLNAEKISAAHQRIDRIVNMFSSSSGHLRDGKKRKMLFKIQHNYDQSKEDNANSVKKPRKRP